MRRLQLIAAALLVGSPVAAESPARYRGEFLQMWDAIVSGQPMTGSSGWFKPSEIRYTWDRLKSRDKNGDGRIVASEWAAASDLFKAIDRDGDGAITAEDLDWSENSTYLRQLNMAQMFIQRGDADGNRKLSKDEWSATFKQAVKGKDSLDADDVRKLLFPPNPPRKGGGGMPPKSILLYGLLTGEIGSGAEGPSLDSVAPDFTLKSPDGKMTITLSSHRGKRPVVLIFGSFT